MTVLAPPSPYQRKKRGKRGKRRRARTESCMQRKCTAQPSLGVGSGTRMPSDKWQGRKHHRTESGDRGKNARWSTPYLCTTQTLAVEISEEIGSSEDDMVRR